MPGGEVTTDPTIVGGAGVNIGPGGGGEVGTSETAAEESMTVAPHAAQNAASGSRTTPH
jgi:hypothetical protein